MHYAKSLFLAVTWKTRILRQSTSKGGAMEKVCRTGAAIWVRAGTGPPG